MTNPVEDLISGNRAGVLAVYEAYCAGSDSPVPLVMIGPAPTKAMEEHVGRVGKLGGVVYFLEKPPVEVLEAAYSCASVLLYPSIAEGFGWPIIEAMACGCPVLTTEEAPMTEIGSVIASYIPPMPEGETSQWADVCAYRLAGMLAMPAAERQRVREAGLVHSLNFDVASKCRAYEAVYLDIVANC